MLLCNSIFAYDASNRYMLALLAFDMLPTATRVAMRLMRFPPITFCS